ncbi:factor for adipocyte [Fusarium albosuccineum]|uniref:Factor for adipocyte n=1 Tax=Fusarium albosuccineum TaxID=1237068 RepID=A0A8H4P1A6_9HYPO|nr:factor for adipocyte [Fusarium albosuccineum]
MTLHRNRKTTATCTICGIQPFPWENNLPERPSFGLAEMTDWWGDVVLLCDPSDEVGHLVSSCDNKSTPIDTSTMLYTIHEYSQDNSRPEIEMHDATWAVNSLFNLPKLKDFTKMVHLDSSNSQFKTFDGRVYIPVHRSCLGLAEKVWALSNHCYIRDMRGLWTALRSRLDYRMLFCPHIGSGKDFAWTRAWPGHNRAAAKNFRDLFGINPLHIPNLTNTILGNLEQAVTGRTKKLVHKTAVRIAARKLPEAAAGTLPQWFWRDQLNAGTLPWLWDIDTELIDAADRKSCPGGENYEWDWELLYRKLSQGVDFGVRNGIDREWDPCWDKERNGRVIRPAESNWVTTGYHDTLKHVPPGLHNRRRVWQLLEEMFVGDVLPWTEMGWQDEGLPEKECMPMLWTKSGRFSERPFWLPRIDIGGFGYKIKGSVYLRWDYHPMQYWQKFKPGLKREPPATVEKINAVLRGLGYPV